MVCNVQQPTWSALVESDWINYECVGGILVNQRGQWLVFFHKKLHMWTIPVGKAEPGEELYTAIKRELEEEIGVQTTKLKLRCQFPAAAAGPNPEDKVFHYRIWYIEEIIGQPRNAEPEKHSNLCWMFPHELLQLPITNITLMACHDRSIVFNNTPPTRLLQPPD